MAGKMCMGTTSVPRSPKLSHAYCEGRQAAAAGALIGTNPHTIAGEAATAWAAGHTSWTADPAGVAGDCCADAYGGGYVPE